MDFARIGHPLSTGAAGKSRVRQQIRGPLVAEKHRATELRRFNSNPAGAARDYFFFAA
jgi:hypothetical protein